MTTRDKILQAVREAQPTAIPLPDISQLVPAPASGAPATTLAPVADGNLARFTRTLKAIGGQAYEVRELSELISWVQAHIDRGQRVVSIMPELSGVTEYISPDTDSHTLANIGLAILKGHFGVAENGAVWVTEECMGVRALPFICEHLALVISRADLVSHMHEAYDRIGTTSYGFGTFIAGPSKTADIEQSLVLGAHGPVGMSVFVVG